VAKTLTDLAVRNAKPGKTRREIADGGCRGLYLVVQPNGSRTWALRYRHAGKTRKLTIGPVYLGKDEIEQPTLDCANTLAGARKLAGEAALLLAKGIDPATEKFSAREGARLAAEDAEAAKGLTVTVLAKRFIRDHAMQRTRESSWRETARLLGLKFRKGELVVTKTSGEVLSRWGERPAHSITRADVNKLLRDIVVRGAPIASNRVLAAIRKMFNWAVGEDILPSSPCAGVSRKADEESRSRVLSDDELRLIWKASDALNYPFPQLTKLLILTMQRRSEVAGIRRGEVDDKGKLWIIPAERAKNGEEHEVPLSDAALAILASCPRIGRGDLYLSRFGHTPTSGFSKAKAALGAEVLAIRMKEAHGRVEPTDAIKPMAHWTWHDLRRSGASGLARLELADIVVTEKILNHTNGALRSVAGIYNRFEYADRKRAALVAWSDHVMKVING
jgi:integrase